MIIITHELFLRTEEGEKTIGISVHKPVAAGPSWSCRYEIDWPEGKQDRKAVGFDALQALVLALQMIGADIYTSAYHREGRLRAYEKERGYGFPVPSSLRDMLVGADAVAF
ncbi:hypothetical protein GGR16_004757 [Chelatococcus caeni]|uniref:DUF6968 domain-containing protein n=1 Tax=Chelatococcus caeni TaxID=1348468 RepID=A0A840C6P1_9HYPH|nr:hypothetical protein [Chelatococcus caeni]MBB4019702.1 hypothetical protein [Chelatococcus caeni]